MRKIAIVGKGGTASLAPWQDDAWEIWGLPWIAYPRVDRLFDIHSQAFWDETEASRKLAAEWEPRLPDAPILVDPSRLGRFPRAGPFPLDRVCATLPIVYLENSIAYMMALAIAEHANGAAIDRIGLWGVHMRGTPEYLDERASVTFLAGLAMGRGISIDIPPGNPLFMSTWNAGRYGLGGGKRMINPLMGATS